MASSSGALLHEPVFTRTLVDSGLYRLAGLLHHIFDHGSQPGYSVYSGGGDFVLPGTESEQRLHADLIVAKADDVWLPPPFLSVNFTVQALTEENGAMRIIPGTQLWRGELEENQEENCEWKYSRLCPLPPGAAILRDVRTLHGGTPNLGKNICFMPSVEIASKQFWASGRRDCFPPVMSMPGAVFDALQPPGIKQACAEIVTRHSLRPWYGAC